MIVPMLVRDVMTRRVLTIDADQSIDAARARMVEAGVQQLVVRGKRGGVKGVIGRADLGGAPRTAKIGDFMPRRLLSVTPDTSIGRAASVMRHQALRSLPVMSGKRLLGIVTVSHLLSLLETEEA